MAEAQTNPNIVQQSETTNNGAIESITPLISEISGKISETSGIVAADGENSLEFSADLMEKGNAALKDGDYSEASDLFSRALEIRVAHYGELAPECVNSYYKFGVALLYKAQEEADPFGAMPKKDAESQQGSVKTESVKNNVDCTSPIASVTNNVDASSSQQQGTEDVLGKSKKDEDDESDTEEEEEDESDLDLAWKMLDLARAILGKHSEETMEMVDILSALAEVSLEREDIETSLSDYQKALGILEHLVESDSRRIAELNFRICLCLEIGLKTEEAIPYCQKAVSACKSRVHRLMDVIKTTPASMPGSAASETTQVGCHSAVASQPDDIVASTQAEIETLTSLLGDLEKKLEDLQQQVTNPSSILSDIFEMMAAKARSKEQAAAPLAASSSSMGLIPNNGDHDSPTVPTAHTNGNPEITDLGVVGRGVKRVVLSSVGPESSSTKRPALDGKGDT
ncbi:uncharacterized protein LOC141643736 [Silene latifolia]|uniref:uncharacterized protein LOC141643736 n=1 Tax=Silene latifolia TaxID=37657 RepID=UPI003D7866B1